jgi:hypothetical protein
MDVKFEHACGLISLVAPYELVVRIMFCCQARMLRTIPPQMPVPPCLPLLSAGFLRQLRTLLSTPFTPFTFSSSLLQKCLSADIVCTVWRKNPALSLSPCARAQVRNKPPSSRPSWSRRSSASFARLRSSLECCFRRDSTTA